MPVWREMTLALLKSAASEAKGKLLVVPMTLAEPGHFREIFGGLRAAGVPVRHFTLVASAETLRRRLRKRLDWPKSKRWALSRAEETAGALRDALFAEHVATDGQPVRALAQAVLTRASS